MSFLPFGSRYALIVVMAATPIPAASAQAPGSAPVSVQSVAGYLTHLESLDTLVAGCQKQRSPESCDPDKVGPDDRVQFTSGGSSFEREVRYDWLRALLDRAGKKDQPLPTNIGSIQLSRKPPVSVDVLLKEGRQRLQEDWKQASAGVEPAPGHGSERQSLQAILARKEYRGVSQSSPRERFIEWLENWLVQLLEKLEQFGSRSPWVGFVLRALFFGALSFALVWAIVRIERRSRIKLSPEPLTVPGAPSAREWQLWLADAHTMAAQDLWREAIHFIYWAAIARLESRHLWHADRARTPREYLRLLPATDPRRENLASLTRSFERTWYGGREAGSADFNAALRLAAALGVE